MIERHGPRVAETKRGYVGHVVRPILILNPRSDETFVAFAHERLAAGSKTAEALEAALRVQYPRATVRERGLASEPATWYVYREGRWTPSEIQRET